MGPAESFIPGATRPERPTRTGVMGLLVLAAACGFIIWFGMKMWDELEGNELVRQLRSRDVTERRSAASNLSSVGRDVNIGDAVVALIRALEDEDSEVRANAARSLGLLAYQFRTLPPRSASEQR